MQPRWITCRLRIQEDGGKTVLLGRKAGMAITLGSANYEWADLGWKVDIERALPIPVGIPSFDPEADANTRAITADELSGILLPGGLATWMIREHPGLQAVVERNECPG